MQELERLKDMLCKELYEISEKGELNAGALETVHKLTDTIKNIDKIEMLENEGEYGYKSRASYGNDYMMRDGHDGRRGTYYIGGHYSRGSGSRYSRGDGKESMLRHMREMMEDAGTEKEREAIKRCISQIENG